METCKRLFRSRKDRVFGGVCGGIGNYIGVDPTIIRLIWMFFLFAAGMGFFIYLVSWLLIPLEEKKDSCEPNCNCDKTTQS